MGAPGAKNPFVVLPSFSVHEGLCNFYRSILSFAVFQSLWTERGEEKQIPPTDKRTSNDKQQQERATAETSNGNKQRQGFLVYRGKVYC